MSAALDALRSGCKDGQYYAPLQSFKTLINRKINGPKKNFDDGASLILQGVSAAAEGLCGPAAVDLAAELVNLFHSFEQPLASGTLAVMRSLHDIFTNALKSTDGASAKTLMWKNSHVSALENLLSWASSAQRSDEDRKSVV